MSGKPSSNAGMIQHIGVVNNRLFVDLEQMFRLAVCKITPNGVYDPKGLLFGKQRLQCMIGYRLNSEVFELLSNYSKRRWNSLETRWRSALAEYLKDSLSFYPIVNRYYTLLRRVQRFKIAWISSDIRRLNREVFQDYIALPHSRVQSKYSGDLKFDHEKYISHIHRKMEKIKNLKASGKKPSNGVNPFTIVENNSPSKRPEKRERRVMLAEANTKDPLIKEHIIQNGLIPGINVPKVEKRPELLRDHAIPQHFPVGFKEDTLPNPVIRKLLEPALRECKERYISFKLSSIQDSKSNFPDLMRAIQALSFDLAQAIAALFRRMVEREPDRDRIRRVITEMIGQYLVEYVEIREDALDMGTIITTISVNCMNHAEAREILARPVNPESANIVAMLKSASDSIRR
jgi:hypothetical protein